MVSRVLIIISYVMKLNQLHNLIRVAEHGSVRQAARSLNLSQPAVTKSIQQLEESLGVMLLDRGTHGVTPTAAGEALIVRARIIEAEIRNAEADIEDLRDAGSGEINIGATPVVSGELLPAAIAKLKNEFPGVSIRIKSAVFPEFLSEVGSGQLDFILTLFPDIELFLEDVTGDEFNFERLAEGQMLPYVRAGHPLTRKPGLTLADLAEWDWVLTNHSKEGGHVLGPVFRSQGVEPPSNSVRTDSNASTVAIIRRTDMISQAPERLVAKFLREGGIETLSLETRMPNWTIGLITRARSIPSPAATKLIDHLRQLAPDETLI